MQTDRQTHTHTSGVSPNLEASKSVLHIVSSYMILYEWDRAPAVRENSYKSGIPCVSADSSFNSSGTIGHIMCAFLSRHVQNENGGVA